MTYRLRNIVIAVALAAVAALLTSFYVSNYKRQVQEKEQSVTVLVATRDIPAGTAGAEVVKQGLLTPQKIARRHVLPGAVSSASEVEKLLAAERIYAGEQVTTRRFQLVRESGIRAQLSGTMRAVQIAGDPHQLLAGTLKAGDRVDVVAAFAYTLPERGSEKFSASRVVLRDLLVLRAPSAPSKTGKITGNEELSVQLAVTDSQARKLLFTITNARASSTTGTGWALQLRPVSDAADSPENVETLESVLKDGLSRKQFTRLYGGERVR